MSGRFHHGADDELRGIFRDLAWIGDHDGPKYGASTLHRLAARILEGRAHELLVFRLCHLVRCASLAGEGARRDGWLEFFCAPGAGRAGWAAGYLRLRLADRGGAGGDGRAVAADDHVALRYPGRETPISIAYGGIPLLAAFMEFLLNTLHYRVLRDALEPLAKPDLTWRELRETANALSRTVYAWLREHTSPVQESRDFDAIARFLAARGREGGSGNFNEGDVDDEAVLAFWREVSAAPDSEFRTYRKTFRAFLRFAEAMREEAARAAFETPLTLGTDRAAGEWDPADPGSPGLEHVRGREDVVAGGWYGDAGTDEAAGGDGEDGSRVGNGGGDKGGDEGGDDDGNADETEEDEDGEPSALDVLSQSEIKFLLGREADLLRLVDAHPRILPRLARSFVRDRCFGHAQGRISQASRTDPASVPALVSAPPETTCEGVVDALEKLHAHLDTLVHAAGHVLLAGDGGGDEDRDGARVLNFERLKRGRRALDGLRRRGFDGIRAGTPESVEAFRRAVPAIIGLRERLSAFCERLRAQAPWALRQAEDEPVFREQFARIYGVSVKEGAGP